jgi:hypothetical protein
MSVLADRLAVAILADGPTSASRLARRVGVRKETVVRELRSSPKFEQLGRGSRTTWRLAQGTGWEPLGTGSERSGRLRPTPNAQERLEALERRVAAIEWRLAETRTRGPAFTDTRDVREFVHELAGEEFSTA